MSLITLPKIDGYRYLEVKIDRSYGSSTTEYSGYHQRDAQYWLDDTLNKYTIANPFKFWKRSYIVKITYYTCAAEYHTFTIKVQER